MAEPPPKITWSADRAVACDHHIVRQDDAVADPAIMGDVGIGEKHAIVTDHRLGTVSTGTGIERHALANDAARTDDESYCLAAEFQILRFVADRGKREDPTVGPDHRITLYRSMAENLHAIAKTHLRSDMAKRPDRHATAETGTVLDYGSWMD